MRLPAAAPALLTALLLAAAPARAGDARWLRYPALSPDGTRIAFSWRGDLWVVPVSGGEARALTRHVAWEHRPVWSPDGARIAFASDRHGNDDVFVMPAEGGPATRLTFHSRSDVPTSFTRDGARVLFASARMDAPGAAIGATGLPELYSVAVTGGRPRQELTTPALEARPSPDGTLLVYEDFRGWESPWRKHHVSAVARDIRLHDPAAGTHRKLTDFRGEDRDPVWAPDGTGVFWLSERSGSFNVWRVALDGSGLRQVTDHGPHPVRFLSVARDGTLAYACEGRIFVRPPDRPPAPVDVRLAAGESENATRREVLRKGATELAVSPEGDEIAFVVRGEVFVASTEHGTTKRVTKTSWPERSVCWAPDGRTLYFARARDGAWGIFRASLARDDETHFFRATVIAEEPVLAGGADVYQPLVSPDGRWLAYLHERDEIRALDLGQGGDPRVLVPKEQNYSYADGDIGFRWSPDSRWLAFNFVPAGRWIEDVGVVGIDAPGEVRNMTLSGYDEWEPRWVRDGDALVFYSNRLGRRSHASSGPEGDLFAIDLTREAHDEAELTVEEYELAQEKERDGEKEPGAKEDAEDGDVSGKPAEQDDEIEPVAIDFERLEDRTRRITLHSARIGGYDLSPDGETVVYFAEMDGKWDLWVNRIRKQETRRLLDLDADGPGDVVYGKDGDAVFVRGDDGAIFRVAVGEGPAERKPVAYAAEMTIDRPAERAYVFEHVWRKVRDKFYEPSLHDVDWDALGSFYRAYLPDLEHNRDFVELLSEMLGELNASHTGAYYRAPGDDGAETASLGLVFDPRHEGEGLRVAEVLDGGPCDRADTKLAPGVVVTHVDGVALTPATNHVALLDHRAGRRVRLGLALPDGTAAEQVVEPVGLDAERELRYRRWVEQRRRLVDARSEGRLGYVHVRSMSDTSFRHVFLEALGRHGAKEGLVVDTRWNGGGWLHDDLVAFLGGRPYLTFHPRGKERGRFGGEPLHRWARPVVVVMNEGNYSDAHLFPYAFRELGLGKLVGAPVAGTGTAVWWERQIDPTIVFGVPQVGTVTPDGRYLENLELQPDVLVYNEPEDRAAGRDRQLDTAVDVLLAEIDG